MSHSASRPYSVDIGQTGSMVAGTDDSLDEAFEKAFRDQHARVWMVAMRLCTSDAEADDLAQEAFARLHAAPVLARPPEEVGAWLVRVVTNLGLNAIRSRRREQGRLTRLGCLEDAATAQRQAEQDPATLVLQDEERRTVRMVLDELPARARACLVLRHSGLSYAEIARALGIAPTSVGTTLARAEMAFAERWRRCGNAV